MTPNVLGIDLGSSGLKLIYSTKSGNCKVREEYEACTPRGWYEALCRAAKQCDLSGIQAIGLSSQVGTYIINDTDCVSWSEPVGQEELEAVWKLVPQEVFMREISMPHPHMISYPLPRLCYIKKRYGMPESVCMPKDYLIERLTGQRVSDPYSWRGLANLETGEYSIRLLEKIGIDRRILPKLQPPESVAGYVTEEAAGLTCIPAGTPVYVGCNDFFAGLLGMGMLQAGSMFDITGTSEHLGLITDKEPDLAAQVVHGPYFRHQALYGVTASSGASLKFGQSLCDLDDESLLSCLDENPPIFLPYLNGERAPVWDADARGVFFGITGETSKREMAYAVMEGVAFSLYHIYEKMGFPTAEHITVAGGAAKNRGVCQIKASLFGLPIVTLCENDTSALGAQMIAMVGNGAYRNLEEAVRDNCAVRMRILPDKAKTERLRERFEIYKELYPALRMSFKKWRKKL